MASNAVVNRTVNIFIQSGEAQRALDALIKKEEDFKKKLESATDPKVIRRLKDDIEGLQEPIDRATRKVNGELEPSLRDTEATARRLRNELSRMSESDAGFETQVEHLRQANTELETQRGRVGLIRQTLNSFWKEAKTVAVGVLVGNTVETMLQTVVGNVTGMVTGSAQIADELADIEKTTGLNKDQVVQLNKELSKIDTRTSSGELRKLASEAGKLGAASVEDVKKFVDQADKIRVALGEDLGDDAVISIGKLSKIFKVEMLNIASAVNEVGANSEASERFSVDFLNRLAGTGPAVGIAADQLLGYSAALEINGQTAEVSGTALSTFFIDFTKDTERFGKAAGFANGELSKLVAEKGTNEGFLQFLTKLKEANPEAADFLNRMQELGIDGSRGANVMLALAGNIDLVRQQQEIANGAIQSNASIMDEFNKKNNNAAAELDKLKKNFAGLFSSDTIREAGAAAVRTLNSFVNVLKAMPKFIQDNRAAIALLITGIVLLNKAYLLSALAAGKASVAKAYDAVVSRVSAAGSRIAAAAQVVYATASALLAGNINLATAAQRAFAAAASIGAGPIGVLVVVIGALVIGMSNLLFNTQKMNAEQRVSAELAQRVADATTDTVAKVKTLVSVIQDEKTSLEGKKKALAELIEINPDFAKTLQTNTDGTIKNTDAVNTYIESLLKKAKAEAQYSLLVDQQKARVGAEQNLKKAALNYTPLVPGDVVGQTANLFGFGGKAKFDEAQEALNKIDENIAHLTETTRKQKQEEVNGGGVGTATTKSAAAAMPVLETLRTKLKALQEAREKATDEKQISGLNVQIKKTQDEISRLEGSTVKLSKAQKTAANDTNALVEELQNLSNQLTGARMGADDREFFELELKYEKLRGRAKNNHQLLIEIEHLYGREMTGLLTKQALRRQEVEEKEEGRRQKSREERAKALKRLVPAQAKLEGFGLQISEMFGREKQAKAELNLLKKQGKDKRDEQLKQLADAKTAELQNTHLTQSERDLIEEKFRLKRGEIMKDYLLQQAAMITEWATSLLNIYNIFAQGKTDSENAELARDKAINDKKKKNLDDRLKKGVISQGEYDRQVAAIEKRQELREKEVRTKQFKRNQKAQIVQALINGAMAVTSTLAAIPGGFDIATLGIARAIQIGLAVATTAAQVATIARQKPPEYARGGKLNGPSHAAGGMGVYDAYGRKQAEVEGNEGIINKFSMSSGRRYSVSGTTSQIASYLNSQNGGGINWDPGATVLRPAWKQLDAQPMNFTAIRRAQHFAQGGVLGAAPSSQPDTNGPVMAKMVETLLFLTQTVDSLQQQLEGGIKAYTVLSEQEKQKDRMDAIRQEATMV